jgi:hypothetical protein
MGGLQKGGQIHRTPVVYPQGDKWMATVGYKGRTLYIGLFFEEMGAAKARDQNGYDLAFPDEIKR